MAVVSAFERPFAAKQPAVFIANEHPCFLTSLLDRAELPLHIYDTIDEFLRCYDSGRPGCAIVCVHYVTDEVLGFLNQYVNYPASLPVIIVSEGGSSSRCAQAFRAGAFDLFEQSSLDDGLFIQRIRAAIELDVRRRDEAAQSLDAMARLERLTPRELQVVKRLVKAKSLKQIAAEFGVSIQTASRHRLRILGKLDVENDVELVGVLWPVRDALCA